jgi:hypothetical protein
MMEMNALLICCKEIRHNQGKGAMFIFESLSISVIADRSVGFYPSSPRPSHPLTWASDGQKPTHNWNYIE